MSILEEMAKAVQERKRAQGKTRAVLARENVLFRSMADRHIDRIDELEREVEKLRAHILTFSN